MHQQMGENKDATKRQFRCEQWNKLNDYFAANKFLIDCLDLAYVSDRQAILDGLLASPV